MSPARKVLACATVIEEMIPLLPPEMTYQVLDFGLHVNPGELKRTLQAAIDEAAGAFDEIILGYGFCSMAVVGLRATACTLVVPKVDDCIAIFLGSKTAYREQHHSAPGTYYLTKGWIEAGDGPFDDYERLAKRFGPEKAEKVVRQMLNHYTRLALIDTGQKEMDHYRRYAQDLAARWDLTFDEIPGSKALVQKMIFGPWDDDFLVVSSGETIRFEDFHRPS